MAIKFECSADGSHENGAEREVQITKLLGFVFPKVFSVVSYGIREYA